MTASLNPPFALRWLRYIGPWPLRPVAAGLLSTLLFIAFTSGQRFGAGDIVTTQSTTRVLAGSLLSGVAIGLQLWMWERLAPRLRLRPIGYAVVIAVTALLTASLRIGLDQFPTSSFGSPAAALGYASLRIAFLLLVVMATVGYASQRLKVQVEATEAALALARQQQQLLVQADEHTRRQVAMLLHDRVQAGLIASCLQLQLVAASSTPQTRHDLDTIIDSLERLRALDVRGAARALGPDLADVDLQSALEELAAQYEPGMTCTIEVSDAVFAHRQTAGTLLGAYRIIEQSLLNAAVHGRSRTCSIRVDIDGAWLVLQVSDDGQGLSDAPLRPGLGSALMDTWTGILGGSWSLSPGIGGAVLRARLPVHPQVDPAATRTPLLPRERRSHL